MQTLEPLLRAHPFFQDLDDAQVRFLTECAKNLRFDAGDFLFREGGDADTFVLVRKGRVTIEVHVPARGAIQVENVGPGDMLGWSWLFAPHRWQMDARAIEPVIALVFDATCIRRKMEQDATLGYAVSKTLLRHMHDRLTRVQLQRMDLYRSEK